MGLVESWVTADSQALLIHLRPSGGQPRAHCHSKRQEQHGSHSPVLVNTMTGVSGRPLETSGLMGVLAGWAQRCRELDPEASDISKEAKGGGRRHWALQESVLEWIGRLSPQHS